MKTGLFGGSFNPVHNGHLMLMKHMREGLGLDRLIMLPTGEAPHKSCAEYAPAADRLEMCRLAAEPMGCEVSDYEIKRCGASYTIDTLRHYSELLPDDELYLLVGGDMLESFDLWREWRGILKLATLAAVCREDGKTEKLEKKAGFLRQYGRIILLQAPVYTVSSTEIRRLTSKGKDFSCYLPKKVVEYIVAKKLYGYAAVDY